MESSIGRLGQQFSGQARSGILSAKALVRGYFPKGTDFRMVSDEDVQKVQDLLNSRPRKAPGNRTPTEVMFGLKVQTA